MLDEKPTRITKFEECAFSVIYKKKLVQSKDKFVYVHNQHGRPSRLISIPKPELGSHKASSSSIRKRSVIVETVLSSVLEPSTSKKEDQADTALTDDKIFQEASLIKRDKPLFVESARKAGINIVTRFDLKDVASFKAKLPWTQIRMMKRAFISRFRFDVFGSELNCENIWES